MTISIIEKLNERRKVLEDLQNQGHSKEEAEELLKKYEYDLDLVIPYDKAMKPLRLKT